MQGDSGRHQPVQLNAGNSDFDFSGSFLKVFLKHCLSRAFGERRHRACDETPNHLRRLVGPLPRERNARPEMQEVHQPTGAILLPGNDAAMQLSHRSPA